MEVEFLTEKSLSSAIEDCHISDAMNEWFFDFERADLGDL